MMQQSTAHDGATAMEARPVSDILGSVEAMAPTVLAHADTSERERRLAQPIMDALLESQLPNMLGPSAIGGLEADPLIFHRATRELARLDGSTGWCTWVANISAWFCSRLPKETGERLLGVPKAYLAGALFPFGTAEAVPGGYTVTGRWPYGSGSQHATWLQGFCAVSDNGQPRVVDGQPEVRMVMCPREQVQIIDTWYVSGLAGTGSNDFVMDGVFIPDEMTAPLGSPPSPEFQSPLFVFPIVGIVPASAAASGLGIAERAIEVALDLAQTKVSAGTSVGLRERPVFQVTMADAVATVSAAESWLISELTAAWDRTQRGEPNDINDRGRLALAAAHGTESAARAVDHAHRAAGGTANYVSSPLQRCLRDVHAVTQHMVTSPHMYETSGRVMVGLEPENPLLYL